MANKKINELVTRTPSLSDLILVGDPSSGYSYKATVTALATIIETDIADAFVTLSTTQTISGAKTFSNIITATSVANTPTDPDKFLTLNASNQVTYRTGSEVLSDIGGQGALTLTTTGTSGTATLVGNTLNIPQYQSVLTNPVTGTGTASYLTKFTGTSTIGNSTLIQDQYGLVLPKTVGGDAQSIHFETASSTTVKGFGYNSFYSVSTYFGFYYSPSVNNSKEFLFNINSITTGTSRIYSMPDASGTLALTSDITSAVSGTTNYIPKFTSSSAIGNSQIFDNGTSVGIGTITPAAAAKLELIGDYRQKALAANSNGFNISINSSTDVVSLTNFYNAAITFGTNNTEQMRLTSTGLGIGTSSPAYKLHVVGATSTEEIARFSSAGTDIDAQITVAPTGGGYGRINSSANMLTLAIAGSSKVYLNPSGNLGLGTSSPAYKLDVNGVIHNNAAVFVSQGIQGNSSGFTFSGAGSNYGRIYEAANDRWALGYSASYGGASTAVLNWNSSGNLGLGVTPSAWYSSGGYNALQVGNASLFGRNSANSELYLSANAFDNSTGTPTYITTDFATRYEQNDGSHKWYYAGSGTAGNAISFTQAMTLDASGRLGIGTTSPAQRLHVYGGNLLVNNGVSPDANSGIRIVAPISTTQYNWMIAAQQNVNNGFEITPSTAVGGTTFSTPALVVTSAGSIGIGTTSPSYRLSITASSAESYPLVMTNGTVQAGTYLGTPVIGVTGAYFGTVSNHDALFGANAGGAYLIVKTSGNVGIGTTSPSAKLHIVATSSNNALKLDSDVSGTYTILEFANAGTVKSQIYNDLSGGDLVTRTTTSANLIFGTNSSERMRITSGGNVGIGTSSPTAVSNFTTLTINGTNASLLEMQAGGTSYARIQASSSEMSLLARGNTPMVFYTNPATDTERMRITSGGNVGIATSSPSYTLDVNGQIRSQNSGTAEFRAVGGSYGGNYNTTLRSNSSAQGVLQLGNNAENYIIGGNTASGGFLVFKVNGTTESVATGTEAMRITNGGIVAIGTTGGITTSTYAGKLAVYTAGGANLSIGGGSNTTNTVMSRFITANTNNGNTGNESSSEFYGITSIESALITTTSNASSNSGGYIMFKTKADAGTLAERLRINPDGGIRLVPQSAEPVNPTAGMLYYDSDDNKLKLYDGTNWVNLN